MKNPWLLPTLTLSLGAAVGFISGKNTGGSDSASVENASAVRARSSQRDASAGDETYANDKRSTRIARPEQIRNLPGSSTRIQALMDFYASLTPEQLEEEAQKLENLPINERILSSFLLFGRWAEVDPTSAMAFSSSMGFTGMFVRPTILNSWASVDPENAARYYNANPREFAMMSMIGGGRGPMAGQGGAAIIASEWARQDPTAAMEWAKSQNMEKAAAMGAVVGEVAKNDPKKAAEMLNNLPGEDLNDAYRSVATAYGAKNFDEAQAWIRTLPADQQDDAMAAAIRGLSQEDPASAAFQLSKMPEGDAKSNATAQVIGDWARVDPAAAADLLRKQDDPGTQQEAMSELMPTWVTKDPAAALQYANSYEPGPVRDSALQSYVFSNQNAAPQELISVAETISDENDRNRSVGIAAARWMRESPDDARAYIEQSDMLNEGAKERILEGRGFWGGGRGIR